VLTLVGGGDPGLGLAAADTVPTGGTLTELAASTAAALSTRGVAGAVALRYDDSLFVGAKPATWPDVYIASGVVAPVSALTISRDEDEVVTDPAGRAATAFAGALTAAGVSISSPPSRATAPAQAEEVAAVESAQLSALVERMLVTSNNDYAEALGRQVAIAAGTTGTSEAATAAITRTVAGLGVDVTGVALADASGLSRSTRLPAAAVTETLTAATAGATAVAAGMSVAGFSGTLAERFDTAESQAGAGLVRGKTGTLTGVSSLAGLVVDADGRLLAFAVIADAVPAGATPAARDALDQVAAALARCGCR
jgi:D-alanyl-D-alanine carboxypeptidase/D-alanyl-D-alanine-endopeptidase (penicillin-binding protein 4)